MEEHIKLLLIDDHTLFREGLARLLEAENGLELIGSFSSTGEALEVLQTTPVHVVLLDFDLGAKNGLELFREFRTRGLQGRILMVTAGMSGTDTARALSEGAAGVFLKHNPPVQLITAIRSVAHGEPWINPNGLQSPANAAQPQTSPQSIPALSSREQTVLKGVFEGLTNKEIAAQLDISESYVKAVLQQLFAKTGVRTRSRLVRVVLERGSIQ
jgi:DNA-binding NarL/FixJ family response regulator